ncbi:MAG TPA: sigma-54 dependent transcriptional regulator [bacterium]|nr:sigma-54 dependent transcriptional regulator [bacterium]
MNILLVDDEQVLAESIGQFLRRRGHTVTCAQSAEAALRLFREQDFSVVISDVRLPETDGIALLRQVKELTPGTAVIMMTGYGTIDNAIAAVRAGAADYLLKPVDLDKLLLAVERAARVGELERAAADARARDERASAGGGNELCGDSAAISAVRGLLAKVAATPLATVLLTGESGTGKELAARAIHRCGTPAAPFVSLNCSGITATLAASELFGHEAGSFTGATGARRGVFELAHGGTLFLDEIGDMPLELQGQLLRVLEERVVRRVGGEKNIAVSVRVISATNRDLAAMVEQGTFRRDLYYRLRVFSVELPPLRARGEDIMPLAAMFLRSTARDLRKAVHTLSPAAGELLRAYDFPGNVRELGNLIEQAVILADGSELLPEHFPLVRACRAPAVAAAAVGLEELERQAIAAALARQHGNRRAAARQLNIGYDALRYKLKKYGLTAEKVRKELH